MLRTHNLSVRLTALACAAIVGLAVNSKATAQCVVPSDTNTCSGTDVLSSNTTGIYNSGFGYSALFSNTEGTLNTASGAWALYRNTTGESNTATGFDALFNNTAGHSNTASGGWALFNNTTGHSNAASGVEALYYSTTGDYNTASGHRALVGNTTGDYNTASGYDALANNFTGNRNTADGAFALINATSNRNVAVGYLAGNDITTGGDNIIIGAGQKGNETDSGVIRIGTKTFQTKAFIAGIRGVTTGRANAVPVVIDANGQLGTISSSRRVKEDIQSMGSVSERLLELRPVTFRYREPDDDGGKPVQFGLVAEEVAQVFPELVVYGADGEPETVSYHLLATLLLNEFQKERVASQSRSIELAQLKEQMAAMAAVIERLEHAQLVAAIQ